MGKVHSAFTITPHTSGQISLQNRMAYLQNLFLHNTDEINYYSVVGFDNTDYIHCLSENFIQYQLQFL
jgi:hypothetical protein